MKKAILFFCSISIALMAVVIIYAYIQVNKITDTRIAIAQAEEFEVKPGMSLYAVKQKLQTHTQINKLGFRLWLKLNPDKKSIKAGLYQIIPGEYLNDFIDKLNKGKEKQFSVTLIEGHTFKQWLSLLQVQNYLKPIQLTEEALYKKIVELTDNACANAHMSLEGCLLPNTYFYTANTSVLDILLRAHEAMESTLDKLWTERFQDIPIKNKYEALILASIIEKETAIDSERTEIAGVFANRLEQNMRLQTDPTVIYGIGDSFNGDITRKDLRTKTPYNTYVIKGLPITPIAMPSEASISAAIRPAITDSLYFVASGSGGHVFSTNLRDHNKAVQQYLKLMRETQ